MDSRFNSPAEIASLVSKSGVTKSMLSLPKMILLGLMAGAFIAFGGAASDVAMHGVADVGLARVVAGVIFPVGLMLVVFTGSELFTGNCLMIIPTLEKKIKPVSMIKNLATVYISNFVGAMIIDLLIFFFGTAQLFKRRTRCFYNQGCTCQNNNQSCNGNCQRHTLQHSRMPCNCYGNRCNRCNR